MSKHCERNVTLKIGFLKVSPVLNSFSETHTRTLLAGRCHFQPHRLVNSKCPCVCELLNRVWLFATTWTVACRIPLCIEFSRQEYWSRLSFLPPADLPNPGIEPQSPALEADMFILWATREAQEVSVTKGFKVVVMGSGHKGAVPKGLTMDRPDFIQGTLQGPEEQTYTRDERCSQYCTVDLKLVWESIFF